MLLAIGVLGASWKRGFVADTANGTCTDPSLFTASSWYYDYNVEDPYRAKLGCAAGGPQAFVPMHWCLSSLDEPVPAYVDKAYMLGFNEPNNIHNCGAHTNAEAIARAYGRVMADYPKSTLVSPATAGDGRVWFRQFFGNCSAMYGPSGCRISHMAIHHYTCNVQWCAAAARRVRAPRAAPTRRVGAG